MTITSSHHDVAVCHDCTVIVANGDETAVCDCATFEDHLDNACGANTRASAMALLLTDAPTGELDPDGNWTCWICSTAQYGSAHLYQIPTF